MLSFFYFSSSTLDAQIFDWNLNGNGNWSVAGNWTPGGGPPNAIDDTANFGTVITANRNVTVDINVTVGQMDFFHDTANREYNIIGTNTITFDVSSGNASLTVDMQDRSRISAPIVLNDDLDFFNANTQNFRIQGIVSGTGGIIQQGGRLTFQGGAVNTYSGDTVVEDGQLRLNRNGTDRSIAGDLTIGDGIGAAGSAIVDYANRNNQIANTSAVTLLSDGLLDLSDENDTIGSLSSSSATSEVQLGAGAAGTLTVGDATNTTFAGIISETGNLVKQGNGTLSLSNNNTYTDTTTINDGTLQISNGGALGTTAGDTTVNTGGTLALTGGITVGVGEDITINGTGESNAGAIQNVSGNNVISSAISLGSDATIKSDSGLVTFDGTMIMNTQTLTVTGTADITINGQMTDGGAGTSDLIKAGSGTLRITNATNMQSGDTTVRAGTLALSADSPQGAVGALGDTPNPTFLGDAGTAGTDNILLLIDTAGVDVGKNIDVNNFGNTITVGGSHTSGTSTFSGTIDLAKDVTLTSSSGGTVDITGTISESTVGSAVTKEGLGTVILNGPNTYTGSTTINAGTLQISADTDLGTAPGAATPGHLTFDGGTLNTTATFTLDSNRGIALNAGGGTIETDPATTLTYGGIIAGAGDLDKTGTGTLVLDGVNTFTGTTTVQTGTLEVTDANALGGTGTGTVVQSGATLKIGDIGASDMAAEPLTINGTGVGGVGALYWTDPGIGFDDWTGDITLGSNATIGSSTILSITGNIDLNGGTLTVDNATTAGTLSTAVISGMGNFVKDGAGTWNMFGSSNTYTGSTTVNEGTLQMSVAGGTAVPGDLIIGDGVGGTGADVAFILSNEQIADTSDVTINSSGRLDVNSFSETIGSLSSGSATAEVFLGAGTLTVGDATSTSFAGVISETGDLVKAGAGTLTLTGTNTFTGDTTINAGVLALNNGSANALDGISDIIITGGSLLLSSDNQIVDTANMELDGGIFDSDANDEVLGTLTLSSDSSIDLGVGTSILDFADSSGLELAWTTSGQILSILDYTGDTNGGGLDQIIFNSQGLTDSQLAAIRFVNPWGSGLTLGARFEGNEIVPVPEPSTYLGAGLILTLIGWRERRRLFSLISNVRQSI